MRRVMVGLCACLFLPLLMVFQGCATTRYISQPTTTPSELSINAGDQRVDVTVDSLIFPDGPGSWVKGARWDEYVLTIRNLSEERIAVSNVRLIDPRGLFIESDVNPWQLEKTSETLADEYKGLGVSVALSTAPAVLLPAMATAGGAGTALAAAPLLPLVAIAGPAFMLGNQLTKMKDREQIQDAFNKRQIGPLSHFTIARAATLKGSVFFPIVPSPQSLVIDYLAGTEAPQAATLEISLEKLKGLHVQGAGTLGSTDALPVAAPAAAEAPAALAADQPPPAATPEPAKKP